MEHQLRRCREYAERHEQEIVAELSDAATCAAHTERVNLRRLLDVRASVTSTGAWASCRHGSGVAVRRAIVRSAGHARAITLHTIHCAPDQK
jgi:hypothetical protein